MTKIESNYKEYSFGLFPVSGAYGRDYKNKADAIADWNANKDFVTAMGQYVNKKQIVDGTRVSIRYNLKRSEVSFVSKS